MTVSKKRLQTLERKALRLWKQAIRLRDKQCKICGGTYMLQAHHLEDYRLNPRLRYDLNNGILLCVHHHKFGSEAIHRSFLTNVFIASMVNVTELFKAKANAKGKFTVEELESIIEFLENEIKRGN